MAEKSLRLSQLAKECNTGENTVMEFLQDQGLDEKMRQTTKISEEYIQLALEQFAPDKAKKEASEKVYQQKKEEKEKLRAEQEEAQDAKKEEPSISGRVSLSGPKMVGKIDLDRKSPAPPAGEVKEEDVESVKEEPSPEEAPAPPVKEKEEEAEEPLTPEIPEKVEEEE